MNSHTIREEVGTFLRPMPEEDDEGPVGDENEDEEHSGKEKEAK